MRCQDEELRNSYIMQLQLLSGWFSMDDMVLNSELAAASARVGAKINEIFFYIPRNDRDEISVSRLRHWNAFLRGNTTIDVDAPLAREIKQLSDEMYGISVFDVCATIVRRANTTHEQVLSVLLNLVLVCDLIMILVLYVPLFTRGSVVTNPIYVGCYLVSATVLTYEYGQTFFLFIYLAVLDVSRFLHMAKDLHLLIRLNDMMLYNTTNIAFSGEEVDDTARAKAKDHMHALISVWENNADSTKRSSTLSVAGNNPLHGNQ